MPHGFEHLLQRVSLQDGAIVGSKKSESADFQCLLAVNYLRGRGVWVRWTEQ